MKPASINNMIRTHTYWLTPKEYRKMGKYPIKELNLDGLVTRRHIYFM